MVLAVLQKLDKPFFGICSYGRSGSSVLMKLLNSSGIAVVGEMPFEDRTSQIAFMAWMKPRFGTQPEQPGGHQVQEANFDGADYYSSTPLDASSLLALETEYERFLRKNVSEDQIGLAEKFIGTELIQIMKIYDETNLIRPIFIARDPRDVFISVKEFNKKRGIGGFNDGANDELLLSDICDFVIDQIKLSSKMGAYLCFYEDFIMRRSQTIKNLMDYIGVKNLSEGLLNGIWASVDALEGARDHMTSSGPVQSVRRWRSEEYKGLSELFAKFEVKIISAGYL
jgi:hypothetical protein